MRHNKVYLFVGLFALYACEQEPPNNDTPKTTPDASTALCVQDSDCDPGYVCNFGICGQAMLDSGIAEPTDSGVAVGRISSDKPSLDFGAATFGSTTVRQIVISNIGRGPLKLLEVVVNGDPLNEFQPILASVLPVSLEPEEQVAVMVGYTPRDGTDDNAELVFVSDDPQQVLLKIPLKSEFKGTAELIIVERAQDSAPQVSQLNFGSVPLSASIQKTFYIKNLGIGTNPLLFILDARTDPAPSNHFTIQTSTNTPAYLNRFRMEAFCGPNSSCPQNHSCDMNGLCRPLIELFEVTVVFQPTTLGNIQERLVLNTRQSGPNTEQTTTIIELVGEGTEANIFVNPEAMDLGTVFIGTGAMTPFQISNTGGATLTVNQVSISGSSEFSINLATPSLPIDLGPSDSISGELHFQPNLIRTHLETIRVESSDPDTPITQVVVTATATLPPIIQVAPTVSFGETHVVRSGAPSKRTQLLVLNIGVYPLIVSSIGFTSGGSSAFSSAAMNLAPIGPGQYTSLDIDYRPTVVGNDSASLVLITNDPQRNRVEVSVQGTAIDPTITVTPTGAVDLGTVFPGATSPTQSLTVSNTGVGSLELSAIQFTSGSSPDFQLSTSLSLPTTLAPNQSVQVDLQYSPSTVGPDNAALEMISSDEDNPVLIRNIFGQASDCQAGTWDLDGDPANGCEYACVLATPPVEICNQQDDDCDGDVDEGFQLSTACNGLGQ